MADINITVNGVVWTLTDDLDGTYSVDLSPSQARQPLRVERDQLKAERQLELDKRDAANIIRDAAIEARDQAILDRTAAIDAAAALLVRIDEIRNFLTTAGDDPDA